MSSLGYTGDLAVTQNTWYHVKITKIGNIAGIKYWTFAQQETDVSTTTFSAPSPATFNYIGVQTRLNTGPGETAATCTIDNIRVHNYISPEPTLSDTGTQETYWATLAISSIPYGAKILINGNDYGLTTDTSTILNPGTYIITMTKAGYQDCTQSITLTSNQSAIVQCNLVLACLVPVCNFSVI